MSVGMTSIALFDVCLAENWRSRRAAVLGMLIAQSPRASTDRAASGTAINRPFPQFDGWRSAAAIRSLHQRNVRLVCQISHSSHGRSCILIYELPRGLPKRPAPSRSTVGRPHSQFLVQPSRKLSPVGAPHAVPRASGQRSTKRRASCMDSGFKNTALWDWRFAYFCHRESSVPPQRRTPFPVTSIGQAVITAALILTAMPRLAAKLANASGSAAHGPTLRLQATGTGCRGHRPAAG